MTIDDLRSALAARGGHADIWLVYVDDIYETFFNGAGTPSRPHAAFWTRGEAYSCAYRVHVESPRHHCSVFRLAADLQWVALGAPRVAELETVITISGNAREIAVTASEVAAVMQG